MSATYIPHAGDSFGVGVGIPSLSGYDGRMESAEFDTVGSPRQSARSETGMADAEGRFTEQSSLDAQWPLQRCLNWLAENNISSEFQEAFKAHHELSGHYFLALVQEGNYDPAHQDIWPHMHKHTTRRQHIKEVFEKDVEIYKDRIKDAQSGKMPPPRKLAGRRQESRAELAANPTSDNKPELSPSFTRETYVSTSNTANPGDQSPGKQAFESNLSRNTIGIRRTSQNRSSTLPNSSQQSLGQPSNEPGHRNFMRSMDRGDSRTHSPTVSTDMTERAHFMGAELRQDSSPKSGSPSSTFASYLPGFHSAKLSASPHSSSFGHRASASNDSVASNTATYGSGIGALAGAIARDREGRRLGHDGSRPYPQDDAPTKESKGFLNKFRKKRAKEDGLFPSPEEHNLESPTSPSMHFKPPYGNSSRATASETSLPGSTFSASEYDKFTHTQRGRHNSPTKSKIYVLATADGWNFRLCDITDVESPYDLRQAICHSLEIHDVTHSRLYITELGKTEHDEPLDDSRLIVAKRTKADAFGGMKIFVRAGPGSTPAISAPPSAGLASAFSNSVGTTDGSTRQNAIGLPGLQTTEAINTAALFDRIGQAISPTAGEGRPSEADQMASFQMSHAAERERRDEAERKNAAQQAKKKKERALSADDEASELRSPAGLVSPAGIVGRRVDFDKPRPSPFEDNKVEHMLPQRKPPPPPAESATLIKMNSLSEGRAQKVGFVRPVPDSRQQSFAERAQEYSPEETNAWGTKPVIGPGSGIGAALVGMGQRLGGVGQPGPNLAPAATFPHASLSEGNAALHKDKRTKTMADFNPTTSGRSSPRSAGGTPDSLTWGKGDAPLKVPDYKPAGDFASETLEAAENVAIAKFRQEELRRAASPEHSPISGPAPGGPGDRRSYGPNLDFTEAAVSFAQTRSSPQNDGSDDDSDDGLFAVPIAVKKDSKPSSPVNDKRPTLTLNTKPSARAKKGVSFGEDSFRTPPTASSPQWSRNMPDISEDDVSGSRDQWVTADQLQNPELRDELSRKSRRTPSSALSEADSAGGFSGNSDMSSIIRRESFMRQDVWANRPPAEALIDHLDDFFPNLDLDQPVLEEGAVISPPPSPTAAQPLSAGPAPTSVPDDKPENYYNDSDTLGSDEPTLKTIDQKRSSSVQSVAQRNIRRSGAGTGGGLGRMKSIREVAKSAHDANKRYTARASAAAAGQSGSNAGQNTSLLRRKSTKMFGANIVQIKPQRGSMMLPKIPQDHLPKRQATFRWFKGQLIGKGTYGRVYLGMNATTGEFLAVKQVEVSKKAAGEDKNKMKELVAALDLEIDTMKDLDHVNIVQYLGCERKESSISIFLEYISGGSVGSCLRKHGKFEEPVVASLTRQTLSGLAYLHREGILHRDLKADNILLDLDGTCKISDFGISKKSDNIYGNDASNSMQGTVFWMAPEVVRSQGHGYSAKVDIWSLGCVVLEMFAGRRPWSKEEAVGAIYKLGMLGEAPPIPDDVASVVSVLAVAFMSDCFET